MPWKPMLMSLSFDQSGPGGAGRAVDRLASLISAMDTTAISPDAIRVEYDAHNPDFAAFASADPEMIDGVLVEISQGLAERVAVTAAGATVAMPDTPSSEALTELALQWVVLHEIGHYADVRIMPRRHANLMTGARIRRSMSA